MNKNKIEQNKTVPDNYKLYINQGQSTMVVSIKSKRIRNVPSSFA